MLVESLARPLEDLEQSCRDLSTKTLTNKSDTILKISDTFNELLFRLDALVVALEGYEKDHRSNFVMELKKCLVSALDQVCLPKQGKTPEEMVSLPDLVLDPLIEVQGTVNSIIRTLEEICEADESEISNVSTMAPSLLKLRDSVSNAVHTSMTLRKPETMEALLNLKEPLIDIKLSLSNSFMPQDIEITKSIATPLDVLEKMVATVIKYKDQQDLIPAVCDSLEQNLYIIQDIKQQIKEGAPSSATDLETFETEGNSQSNEIQSMVNNLQLASNLGTVHFELATILEDNKSFETAESLPVTMKIVALRKSIGSSAIEIDEMCMSRNIDVENIVKKLLNLEEPLLDIKKALQMETRDISEQPTILMITEPLNK